MGVFSKMGVFIPGIKCQFKSLNNYKATNTKPLTILFTVEALLFRILSLCLLSLFEGCVS